MVVQYIKYFFQTIRLETLNQLKDLINESEMRIFAPGINFQLLFLSWFDLNQITYQRGRGSCNIKSYKRQNMTRTPKQYSTICDTFPQKIHYILYAPCFYNLSKTYYIYWYMMILLVLLILM